MSCRPEVGGGPLLARLIQFAVRASISEPAQVRGDWQGLGVNTPTVGDGLHFPRGDGCEVLLVFDKK